MKNNYTEKHIEKFLDLLYAKTSDARLTKSETKTNIIKKVEEASRITNLSVEELLRGLDFKPNDLTIQSLESFIAELRAIFWLRNFKFSNIQPIQASNKGKQADFTATYENKTYAVEVFCLTQANEQKRDSKLGVYINFNVKFICDFIRKENKKSQLDAMSNVDRKILLCVANSRPVVALNTADDFKSLMKQIYESLGWGNSYFAGLATGSQSSDCLDDVIYPSLEY
jgi:PHD/YefM family antitoxin component YafN of YafNO toxin-antitoxin module